MTQPTSPATTWYPWYPTIITGRSNPPPWPRSCWWSQCISWLAISKQDLNLASYPFQPKLILSAILTYGDIHGSSNNVPNNHEPFSSIITDIYYHWATENQVDQTTGKQLPSFMMFNLYQLQSPVIIVNNYWPLMISTAGSQRWTSTINHPYPASTMIKHHNRPAFTTVICWLWSHSTNHHSLISASQTNISIDQSMLIHHLIIIN